MTPRAIEPSGKRSRASPGRPTANTPLYVSDAADTRSRTTRSCRSDHAYARPRFTSDNNPGERVAGRLTDPAASRPPAAATKDAQLKTNAPATPAVATSTPPTAGPASMATCSLMLTSALAGGSSSFGTSSAVIDPTAG